MNLIARSFPKRTRWLGAMLVTQLFVVSCATPPKARRTEPPYIEVQNNTGQDLFSVSIREARPGAGQSQRLGSVSPLSAGQTYSIGRRADSQPLSDLVLLEWEPDHGVPRSVLVSVRQALGRATGMRNEALVFSLQSGGSVLVSVKRAKIQ